MYNNKTNNNNDNTKKPEAHQGAVQDLGCRGLLPSSVTKQEEAGFRRCSSSTFKFRHRWSVNRAVCVCIYI